MTKPETRNPKPETRNPKPETRNHFSVGYLSIIMLFLISSGCEERDLDKKSVARYSLVEIASDAPPGEELVYSKVEKRSRENGEILDSSVVGSIDNQIYQRAARPYTYLGSQEPFIYRDESETATDEDGNTIYIYKIFRQANLHPVDPVPVYALPAVSERLQNLIDEKVSTCQTQNETVEVEIKLRNVPEYNIPLLPRVEAIGTSEESQVLQERTTAITNRRNSIEAMAAPLNNFIESIDGTVSKVMGDIGWVRAVIPVDSTSALFARTDIARVTLANGENVDNLCVRGPGNSLCTETSHYWDYNGYTNDMDHEWYLGDGAKPERLDSQRFYDSGYTGSIANSAFHSFGALTLGIIELSTVLKDETVFLQSPSSGDRLVYKRRCKTKGYCSCWDVYCDLEWFGCSWSPTCDSVTSFPETDEEHATMVTSIASEAYYSAYADNKDLGDGCFNYYSGDESHCPEFYSRAKGMAPNSKVIFTGFQQGNDSNSGTVKKAYDTAIADHVDVMNLSHGLGATDIDGKCKITIQESYEESLENAFDQGIFVVNSTGNYSETEYGQLGAQKTKDDCLVNSRASKPKVFAVPAIYNHVLGYGKYDESKCTSSNNYTNCWETGYAGHEPQLPDDYHEMRLDPNGSQTGGGDVVIDNVPHSRVLSIVDLAAPGGGFRATNDDGNFGETKTFGGQSSAAAPHVSGLAILIKHWMLATGQTWINSPGRLHTMMLGMGDRAQYNYSTHSFDQIKFGSDANHRYGFGRIKLRLLTGSNGISPASSNYSMKTGNWTSSSVTDYYSRIFTYGISNGSPAAKMVKCVFNQDEDMSNKSSTDMVSKFTITLQIYDGAIKSNGYCPYTPPSGVYPIFSRTDDSYDIKKMVAIDSGDQVWSGWPPHLVNIYLNNRCVYLKIHKDHTTPQGVTAHWFCYYAGVMDNAN